MEGSYLDGGCSVIWKFTEIRIEINDEIKSRISLFSLKVYRSFFRIVWPFDDF